MSETPTILDHPKVKEKYDHAKDIIKSILEDATITDNIKFLEYSLNELKKNNNIFDFKIEKGSENTFTILIKPIRSSETVECKFII